MMLLCVLSKLCVEPRQEKGRREEEGDEGEGGKLGEVNWEAEGGRSDDGKLDTCQAVHLLRRALLTVRQIQTGTSAYTNFRHKMLANDTILAVMGPLFIILYPGLYDKVVHLDAIRCVVIVRGLVFASHTTVYMLPFVILNGFYMVKQLR